jgi:hypothetical protein
VTPLARVIPPLKQSPKRPKNRLKKTAKNRRQKILVFLLPAYIRSKKTRNENQAQVTVILIVILAPVILRLQQVPGARKHVPIMLPQVTYPQMTPLLKKGHGMIADRKEIRSASSWRSTVSPNQAKS